MATEVIVTEEFTAWYAGLSHSEQLSVGRVVGILEERGATLGFPSAAASKVLSFRA
jgi:hypothetical protein